MKILFNEIFDKSRTTIFLCSFICLGLIIVFLLFDIVSTKPLSDLRISEQEYERLKTDLKISSQPLIKDLYFNNYKLIKDDKENFWIYSIIDENKDKYNPLVNIKANVNKKIKIGVLEGIINDEKIAKNIPLSFIAYNNEEYYTFSVICTTLPIISIKNNDIYIFDNSFNALEREFKSFAKIQTRGNNSRFFSKEPYSIKLKTISPGKNMRNSYKNILGMQRNYHWQLYAAYSDATKAKEVFSNRIWTDCCKNNKNFPNINMGIDAKYVELFMNDEYKGLYVLRSSINYKNLNLLPNKEEYIFKKSNYFEPWLLKRASKKTKIDPIKYIEEYEDIVLSSDVTKEKISELYSMVDISNAIDLWLFLVFVQGTDHEQDFHSKNLYIIRKYLDNDEYKLLFIPWDLNLTWGAKWDENAQNRVNITEITPKNNIYIKKNVIYYLLVNGDEKIKQLVKQRYSELRQMYWKPEVFCEILEELEKDIFASGAYIRDKELWVDGNYLKNDKTQLSDFKKYVVQRIKYMDLFVEEITKNNNKGILINK